MSAALYAGAIGVGALQLYSGFTQARMFRDQARFNKRIADMNAKWAEHDAWEAEKYGFTESARYQSLIDKTVSEQRAIMASKNIDVSTGTAKELQEETKLIGYLNQLDIQNRASLQARGLKNEAGNLRLGGRLGIAQAEAQAGSAILQGIAGAGTTGLSAYARS